MEGVGRGGGAGGWGRVVATKDSVVCAPVKLVGSFQSGPRN